MNASFIGGIIAVVVILLIIAVIGKLGVETTSFAALLASAGSGYRYGTFRKLAELCGWTDCLAVPSFQGR